MKRFRKGEDHLLASYNWWAAIFTYHFTNTRAEAVAKLRELGHHHVADELEEK